MVTLMICLEPVTVCAQRPVVARIIVISIAVDVVHIQLAWMERHKAAMLAARLLRRQLAIPMLAYPGGSAQALASSAEKAKASTSRSESRRILTAAHAQLRHHSA